MARVLSVALLLVVTGFSPSLFAMTVVANSSISENTFTKKTLRSIFLGEVTQWLNGQPVILCIDHTDETEKDEFYSGTLRKNEKSYQRFWLKKIFSGNAATKPRIFKGSKKLLEYIANREGAICMVAEKPKKLPAGVKYINIVD